MDILPALRCDDWTDEEIKDAAVIRRALSNAGWAILDCTPDCNERAAAIRKLREAWVECVMAIRHGSEY